MASVLKFPSATPVFWLLLAEAPKMLKIVATSSVVCGSPKLIDNSLSLMMRKFIWFASAAALIFAVSTPFTQIVSKKESEPN
ncbi:hypothetical protein D3C86_1657110 [compost metagenome]